MLSVNGRISRDASRDDTTWLRRPESKVEKVFKRQISRSWKLLMDVTCGLSEEGSRETNEQEYERVKCFWFEDRSSKSKRRYRLVVRLKAIEYKENYLCYLSSIASFHPIVSRRSFPWALCYLLTCSDSTYVRYAIYWSTTPSRLYHNTPW